MMEYDRSKDPMLAMDYARSSTPNYGDLHREIERLLNACLMYDRKIHEKDLVIDHYRAVMEQAVEALEKPCGHDKFGGYHETNHKKALTALSEALNNTGEET